MAAKQNCWEFKKCGREPNGAKAQELGVCPAAVEKRVDGMNGGCNGGRACWAIAGTLCGGMVQGTFAAKFGNCRTCEFHQKVQDEESGHYVTVGQILQKIEDKVHV